MAEKTKGGREVPRPFQFHWGGGQIVEEASYVARRSLATPTSGARALPVLRLL